MPHPKTSSSAILDCLCFWERTFHKFLAYILDVRYIFGYIRCSDSFLPDDSERLSVY